MEIDKASGLPCSPEVQEACQKSKNSVYMSFCSFSIHQDVVEFTLFAVAGNLL
jgi:hypothetical protein